ncbi:MAG TPA: alpha-2-macroglobulin [Azospirillum sp.]|nr:alpha-2-macroglobulin [Azospirillum sp.]
MQRALARVFAVLVAGGVPALAAEAPPTQPQAQPAPAPAPQAQPTAEVPFGVASVEVVAEREVPQACFTFTARLEKTRAVDYRAYVAVTPAPAAMTAVARDRTLCVEGLQHGQKHEILLRQGLPGDDGKSLTQDERRDVEVPNRKPSLAFRGGGYVLPRVGAEGLPLRTINVERARLQVLRIVDRSLVEKIYFGRVSQQMSDYDVGEIVDRAGQEVWKGEMAVEAVRNAPVVTAFPIDAVLGKLEPGVYIAVAGAGELKPGGWDSKATQWFLVSDLGLNTIRGEDGLLVFARSIGTAKPAAGVELRLLARDNTELGKLVTGEDGLARFDGAALHGTGPKAPQALFAARGAGDFSFLDLTTTGAAPGAEAAVRPPADAYLYTGRGIYRPGEAIDLTALLRDADARAIPGKPLTVKLLRPDGFEADRRTIADAGAGGGTARFALPANAYVGAWTITAHLEPEGPAVGRAEFLVDDFVPPRLDVTMRSDRKDLTAGAQAQLAIDAHYLTGSPAADLPGELTLTLRAAGNPYPDHAGYRFGLAQEELQPVRSELPGFTTDDAGRVETEVTLAKAPDSSKPLEAVLRANVFDIGGRPVQRELVLPLRHQPFAIGVRPRFDGDGVPEGATAGFDVIAVAPDGTTVARGDLSYELYEEEHDYVWYEANGRWDYQVKVKDRRVTGGTLQVAADKPATVEEPVQAGRYRLEVFDPKAGVATSVRFVAGWWVTAGAADRPDKVDVTVMLPNYRGGETAWVYVKPPYESEVLIAVADRKVRRALTRSIGPEGAFLEIPVDPSWTGGVHVLATAFGAADPQQKGPPRRAIGQSWLAIDSATHVLGVALSAPAESEPQRTVTAEVTVAGVEEGQPAFVTLAAVDDAVLQLTDHAAPDPNDHYLGRRRPAVEMRDSFGRLIDPANGERTRPRAGEAPRVRQVGGLPQKTSRVVALFSGVLPVGADGKVSVPLELPDFNGRLRLMAVAWSGGKLGHTQARMLVRDSVVADLALPRFLAPGDKAQVMATLDNLSGPAGDYTLTLSAEGAVALADGVIPVKGLARGKRASVGRVLEGTGVGLGTVRLEVSGPDGFQRVHEWDLAVRADAPRVMRRTAAPLPPEKEVTVAPDAAAGLRPETAVVALSLGTLPEFDVPNLLQALERHPYGSAEQVAGRVLPLLQSGDLPGALGLATPEQVRVRVQRSLDRLMTMQRPDGAFALWSPKGDADLWLSSFVMDVLGRAKTAGYTVPDVPYKKGLDWLRQVIDNTWFDVDELPGRAYAHYVLARGKAVDAAAVRYFQETFWPKLQTDMARAQVAAALALMGEGKRASEAFDGLSHARVVAASLRDFGSVVRDEAAVVTLMAESGAVERDKLVAAVDRLVKVHAAVSNPSTQEQAWLLMAARALADRSGPVKLLVAGQPVEANRPFYRRVEGEPLTVKNVGAEPLHQVVSVAGVPDQPAEAVENGLSIRRSVFDMDGRPVDPASVRQNDLLVVILEGASSGSVEHQALVTDMLPAGFAIENVRVADSGQLGALSWLGVLSQAHHVDFRADRFVAAVDLSKERPSFRLVYLARAVTPGDYLAPGAFVEDMVKPHLNGRAAAARVRVHAD